MDTAAKAVRRGYANIFGTEFINCGQFDTERGGLNFWYVNDKRILSNVIGNSFHDSQG
jgi:hypothetical protein